MTRVGIDYTAAVQQSAGIGRYTRKLIGTLAELDRENQYVLFSAGRGMDESWPANFTRRALPVTDRHLSILWQRLRLPVPIELFTGRLDIFHSPDFVLPPVVAARTALTIHDLSFMRHPECSSPPLLEYLLRSVPRSVARADLLLADSESTRQDLIELLGVPQEKVTVVYAGVEEHFLGATHSADGEAILKRYGIRRPYILGLGTLQPRKNFARLVEAYSRLRQEHRVPHQLVIGGGPGWLYAEIEGRIRDLHLQEEVRLTGFVADQDLSALYAGADVFAFPSLYEGFGIPVLEAMACGTPVVTSNASSLPEVAGGAALLVSPTDVDALADALWRLIDDAVLCNELRQRGFDQVRRFTWDAAAKQLLAAYTKLAA